MYGVQRLSLIGNDLTVWLLLLSCLLSGCQLGGEKSIQYGAFSCEGCIEALPINGWCESCSHGLVAGLVIPSRQFHEALDAHGHEVDTETILCNLCREVARQDQFCPRCRHGFVAGQLYFSELTWSLARGDSAPTDLSCSGCREHVGGLGDCKDCHRYWVGTVCFISTQDGRRAEQQYRRLLVALERLPGCSECAIGGFFGFQCRSCATEPIPNPLK
ncbi:MAG: hypothetical protein VX764_04745 [Planctomycetota bacterium]|nr:hypothetical protein [Planctomycetota bacterium]